MAITDRAGTERDIMQLVVEIQRDSLCVHEIVHGLRGKDRGLIETVLKRLPSVPEELPNVQDRAGTERDIMQFASESEQLKPEVYRAVNHLFGNRSSYLRYLVQLVEYQHDWRTLPSPARP